MSTSTSAARKADNVATSSGVARSGPSGLSKDLRFFFFSFLESVAFFLYISYAVYIYGPFLEWGCDVFLPALGIKTPAWRTSSAALQTFCFIFCVDYAYRRFLCRGFWIDAGFPLIRWLQGTGSLVDFIATSTISLLAAWVTFQITAVLYPVQFATWDRERFSVFGCFLAEFFMCFLHNVRLATGLLYDEMLLSSFAKLRKRSPEVLRTKARGVDAVGSFTTAAIIVFGSLFANGGPTLNLIYSTMSALRIRSWPMFLTLGSANLLGAAAAAKYARLEILENERKEEEEKTEKKRK